MDEKPTQFTDVADIYDNLMSVVPYSWWVEYVERLWTSFDHHPKRVLDVACGTGNVTRELLKRGYEVAGVDNSAAMLNVARRKLPDTVPLFCQDARELSFDGPPFDAVVCLFDSLNYLLEPQDLHRAFRAVRRHLPDGGPFVFDMNAIRALEAGMFDQRGTGRDADLEYEWHSAWDPISRICTIRMEFHQRVNGDEWDTLYETHLQRGYTLEEISRGLEDCGFEVMAIYDAFTNHRPTAKSDRYHVLAERR
jgi:ubiquinone/menaquinone biosynthesis C-methylase UbiE